MEIVLYLFYFILIIAAILTLVFATVSVFKVVTLLNSGNSKDIYAILLSLVISIAITTTVITLEGQKRPGEFPLLEYIITRGACLSVAIGFLGFIIKPIEPRLNKALAKINVNTGIFGVQADMLISRAILIVKPKEIILHKILARVNLPIILTTTFSAVCLLVSVVL
jgi:hypothetical protein